MPASTVAARPICVLLVIFVDWVCALVLFAGPVACVRNLVLCAGADVCNLVSCFLVQCLCFFLWTDPPSEVMVWIIGVSEKISASWILFSRVAIGV